MFYRFGGFGICFWRGRREGDPCLFGFRGGAEEIVECLFDFFLVWDVFFDFLIRQDGFGLLGIQAGGQVRREEAFADAVEHEGVNKPGVGESHLVFGRVNIDVDDGGIEFEEQEARRLTVLGHESAIGLAECMGKEAIADGSFVDKEVLPGGRRFGVFGSADVGAEGDFFRLGEDLDQAIGDYGTEDVVDPPTRSLRRRQLQKCLRAWKRLNAMCGYARARRMTAS